LLTFQSDAEAIRYVQDPPRDRRTMRTVLAHKVANTSLAHDDDLLELAVVRAEDQILIGDVGAPAAFGGAPNGGIQRVVQGWADQ
jgi:hypothetical protein